MIEPILVNKRYKDYDRVSRYSVFPIYFNRVDKKYIYGLTSNLRKSNTTYVMHKVEQGDTLDTISLYYYNSPLYFWIVADYNDILDPYEDLKEGTMLRIPTFNNIEYDI